MIGIVDRNTQFDKRTSYGSGNAIAYYSHDPSFYPNSKS